MNRPHQRFLPVFLLQQAEVGHDCSQPTDLKVKVEQPVCKSEPSSPQPCAAEDQTEPVDLSLNKPRSSSLPASTVSATVNPAPSGAATQPGLSATPVPSAVQSIGSMVTTHSTPPLALLRVRAANQPPLCPSRSFLQAPSWPLRAPAANRSCTSSTQSPQSACPARWASSRPSPWWCSRCRWCTPPCQRTAWPRQPSRCRS